MQIEIESEGDRDALLLALAILSLDRPGWLDYLRGLAGRIGGDVTPLSHTKVSPGVAGEGAFDYFRRANADRWAAAPPAPSDRARPGDEYSAPIPQED
jgi:hypothetical protein